MKKSYFLFLAVSAISLSFPNLSQASECALEDKRVCEYFIQMKDFFKGPNIKLSPNTVSNFTIGAENEWIIGGNDIIHLGDTQSYSDVELKFLLAHEYAHTLKGHSRKLLEENASLEDKLLPDLALYEKYKDKLNPSMELNHAQEFEADSLAIDFLEMNNNDSLEAIKGVLRNNNMTSNSHPSRRKRLEKAKDAIAIFRKNHENTFVAEVKPNKTDI